MLFYWINLIFSYYHILSNLEVFGQKVRFNSCRYISCVLATALEDAQLTLILLNVGKVAASLTKTINTNYCLLRKLHNNTNTFGPQNPLDHPFEEKRYGYHKKYRHIFDKASVLPFHTSHILLSQLLTVPHLDSYDMLVTH